MDFGPAQEGERDTMICIEHVAKVLWVIANVQITSITGNRVANAVRRDTVLRYAIDLGPRYGP